MSNEEVAFVDGIIQAAREVLTQGAEELHGSVQGMLELAVIVSVRTPHPEPQDGFFFGEPTNEPWTAFYGYYTEAVLPVTILIIALAISMILFTGIFGSFLTGYERSRSKRRLVVAFLFVLAWWGIGAFVLRFVDALALAISPEPALVASTFEENMAIGGHGTVTTSMISVIEAVVIIVLIVSFFVRWVGIYALMLATPIGIAFWIVDVGPFAYLSALIEELLTKFIPLAFITIPAAVVYRVGDLLFANFDPASEFGTGVGPFFLALSFPLMTLVVSYFIFFKLPSFRNLTRPAQTEMKTERQAVEKGREAGIDDSSGGATGLYKGRDGSDAVPDENSRRQTDLSTAVSGGSTRPTRRYEATGGAETSPATDAVSRSRRKISEIGRWE